MTDALVYPARINGLAGEPGGGKTWVALHTCAEAIKDGHHVLFIDLEDHAGSTVARLKALGCSDDEILERFHYSRPQGAMTDIAMGYLERKIAQLNIALIVIDSIGELLAMQGVKPNDDDAVARLYRAIPRHLADLGPAVLLLDHVPKNNETSPLFPIGSQRKKAAIDGAMYMVETVKAFSADTPGKIVLRTAKDRNGNFTPGSVAAEIDVTPGANGGRLVLDVRAPDLAADGTGVRQTVNMGKVSRYLEGCADASANRSLILAGSGVHTRHLTTVLTQMEDEGWISKYPGGLGKADRYCLIKPFDDLEPAAGNSDPNTF